MHIWQSLKLSPHNESQKRHKHENDSKNITKYLGNSLASSTLIMINSAPNVF